MSSERKFSGFEDDLMSEDLARKIHRHKGARIFTDPTNGEVCCSGCSQVISQKTFETHSSDPLDSDGRIISSNETMDTLLASTTRAPVNFHKRDWQGKGIGKEVSFHMTKLYDAEKTVNKSGGVLKDIQTNQMNINLLGKLKMMHLLGDLTNRYQTYKAAGLRTRENSVLSAAALMVILKEQNIPRTYKEVSQAAGVDVDLLKKTYRRIALDYGVKSFGADPSKYLSKNTSLVKDPVKLSVINKYAVGIIQKYMTSAEKRNNNTLSVAAAASMMAMKINGIELSQRKVAGAYDISFTSVKLAYDAIENAIIG